MKKTKTSKKENNEELDLPEISALLFQRTDILKKIASILASTLPDPQEINKFFINCGLKKESPDDNSSSKQIAEKVLLLLANRYPIPRQLFFIIEELNHLPELTPYRKDYLYSLLKEGNGSINKNGLLLMGLSDEFWIDKDGKEYQPEYTPNTTFPIAEITFNNMGEIRINDILLSTPNLGSPNDIAFSYIYEHPNEKITRQDIKDANKQSSFNKDLSDVIKELGFIRELKDLFFPAVSNTAVRFINPVTTDNCPKKGNLKGITWKKVDEIVQNIVKKRKGNSKKQKK